MSNPGKITGGFGVTVAGLVVIIAAGMWIGPTYNVWSQAMEGEAELHKAEVAHQIAALDAQAEVTRILRYLRQRHPRVTICVVYRGREIVNG